MMKIVRILLVAANLKGVPTSAVSAIQAMVLIIDNNSFMSDCTELAYTITNWITASLLEACMDNSASKQFLDATLIQQASALTELKDIVNTCTKAVDCITETATHLDAAAEALPASASIN